VKYAALLRGINVGGKNKLAMKDLIAIVEEGGCTEVATFIQSGNVIFRATPAIAKTLPAAISRRIEDRFGLRVPVMVRTGPQLEAVIANNPYVRAGVEKKMLYVSFLADKPSDQAVKSLDPARSSPDTFHVSGQEIYMHLPNGAGNSKLTNAWFDSRLATVSTARNWATVLRLTELTSG
jgi:uncharacterized protein (DUF1697 family)